MDTALWRRPFRRVLRCRRGVVTFWHMQRTDQKPHDLPLGFRLGRATWWRWTLPEPLVGPLPRT